MPTYDVTYLVSYRRTVRVDADDADDATEQGDVIAAGELPKLASRPDVSYYSCEVARKDDDA